jgi:hypothetical protein
LQERFPEKLTNKNPAQRAMDIMGINNDRFLAAACPGMPGSPLVTVAKN